MMGLMRGKNVQTIIVSFESNQEEPLHSDELTKIRNRIKCNQCSILNAEEQKKETQNSLVSFNLCCLGDFEARENRFIHNHGIDLQAKTRCDLIPEVGVSLVFFFFFF